MRISFGREKRDRRGGPGDGPASRSSEGDAGGCGLRRVLFQGLSRVSSGEKGKQESQFREERKATARPSGNIWAYVIKQIGTAARPKRSAEGVWPKQSAWLPGR